VQTGNYKTYENGLGAEIEGLETMISFDIGVPLGWDRSLALYANSTHIFKAEEEQSDGTMKDIHNVADYTINYGVQYKDGLFDGKVHVRNQGKMKDTDWVTAGYPEIEYPSFTVVDMALGVTLFHHHRLLFKVDNLFDEDYYEKKGYPKPGRAFHGSYGFEFLSVEWQGRENCAPAGDTKAGEKPMRILYIHSLMFHHRTWQQAAGCLAEMGIDLRFAHQSTASALLEEPEAEAFD